MFVHVCVCALVQITEQLHVYKEIANKSFWLGKKFKVLLSLHLLTFYWQCELHVFVSACHFGISSVQINY